MIKRLRLIKNLILHENFDELMLEVEGLELKSDHDEKLKEIVSLLKSGSYQTALKKIEEQIHHKSIPQHKQKTSVLGLKTQVRLLETELSVLIHKKAELNKTITNFRLKHHSTLGMIIGEILHIRKEIALKDIMEKNPDEGSQEKEAFEKAKNDHEEFKKSSEFTRRQVYKQLSKEKKKQLQLLFRKASKLCHPDVVNEDVKEQAEILFTQLNNAYYMNDLHKVREIYDLLQQNLTIFTAKWGKIDEIDRLEAIINKLNTDVYAVRSEIEEIKDTEAYQTISAIEDWDEYFDTIKEKLQKELAQLRKKYERKQEPGYLRTKKKNFKHFHLLWQLQINC